MSLREQLRELLPQILPPSPADAIKGTELIRLVRLRLHDGYSDATLRYHFSILSYDPTSPIAKVDQGQGYYLRTSKADYRAGTPIHGLFVRDDEVSDIGRSRLGRFEAVVERHCLHGARFPFVLPPAPGAEWELPDLVITDWDLEAGQDETPRLDETLMSLKRHLGAGVVTLTAARLQLGITLESCRADFFRALSTARWANQGQIFIAGAVTDEALVDTLRALGHEYGIGVTSFGFESPHLDDLPPPDEIRRASAAEFESLQVSLRIQRIAVATCRPQLDWPALSALRKKHEGIAAMLSWLGESLESGQPVAGR